MIKPIISIFAIVLLFYLLTLYAVKVTPHTQMTSYHESRTNTQYLMDAMLWGH